MKKIITMSLIGIFLSILLLVFIFSIHRLPNNNIVYSELSPGCGDIELYYSNNINNIYIYCFDELNYKNEDEIKELREYLGDITDINYEKIQELLFYNRLNYKLKKEVLIKNTDENGNEVIINDNKISIIECKKEGYNDIYLIPHFMDSNIDFCIMS